MNAPRHLVAVWNPSYAEDAMEAHLGVLLDWYDRFRKNGADWDDVYVWWARLRSANRLDPLPHVEDVLALRAQIETGQETHLYLTDYRSLYVGLLAEIETINPLEEDDGEHLPPYAFLSTGEATFRARRQDPSYDFSTVTVEYAKAVEAELNGVIFPRLRGHYSKGNPVGRHTNEAQSGCAFGAHQSRGCGQGARTGVGYRPGRADLSYCAAENVTESFVRLRWSEGSRNTVLMDNARRLSIKAVNHDPLRYSTPRALKRGWRAERPSL